LRNGCATIEPLRRGRHLYRPRQRSYTADGDFDCDSCRRYFKKRCSDDYGGPVGRSGQRNADTEARRLGAGATFGFVATVTNDVAGAGVTWTATSGTFTAQSATTATFTAPISPGSITVTATSVADVTKNASATIGVTDLAGVTTYHNDWSRDGVNAQEYALNATNVTTSTFGKLFSCSRMALSTRNLCGYRT
jgi:hypothetical protein